MKYKMKLAGETLIFASPDKIYDYIIKNIYRALTESTHVKAMDVKQWCESANVGDTFTDSRFSVECVYNFNIQ